MSILALFLLAVFSLYISVWAFVRWDASWLRAMDTIPVQILFILVTAVLLGSALLLIYRLLEKAKERDLKRLALLCVIVLAAGQLLFLLIVKPMLRYDPLKVFDMAVEMLSTGTISGTYETGYFSRYTNNYPLTILTYWFLLFLSRLGVTENFFMPAAQLINVACITASIWIGYLILKELRNRRTAVFYLIVCVICPLSYVWAGYFYTATCSMPFLMGILYSGIKLEKSGNSRSRCLLGGLLGAVLILGYKLRATAMIAFIALTICAVLKLWTLLRRNYRGKSPVFLQTVLKKYAGAGAAFLLAAALSLGFWSAAVDRCVDFDYKNTGFPAIHWIMMGARWDGSFDQNDEFYTSSFETRAEKSNADKQLLMERIREAGPAGLLSLAGRKLLNTWVDGTDDYLSENSCSACSKVYDYLLGNKSGFLTIYAQGFRALEMLVIGLAALFALRKQLRKRKRSPLFLVQLTLLGGMSFHLIWETSPLYSIGFTFLGLMLLSDGLAALAEADTRRILPKAFSQLRVYQLGRISCTVSFVLLLLLLALGKKQLVETPIEERNYCVNQYQYAGETDGYVTSYEDIYVQTFTTDRPFNRISIRALNPVGEYNQSAFLVKLTAEDGTVLYDNDRFLSGMVVKNTPYEFVLDELVTPQASTTYTLTITPGYIEDENSLQFLAYNTGNCDMYPGGSLVIGSEEQKNGDLAFAVYEYKVTTYFSMKQYLALCAGMALLAGLITAGMWRTDPRRD